MSSSIIKKTPSRFKPRVPQGPRPKPRTYNLITEAPVFILFPKLPLELRHRIWHFALGFLGPKLIELRSVVDDLEERQSTFIEFGDKNYGKYMAVREDNDAHDDYWTAVTPNKIPALLYTCREAREEALRSYDKLSWSRHPGTWCDFNRDTICLAYNRLHVHLDVLTDLLAFKQSPPNGYTFSKLKYLAIEQYYLEDGWFLLEEDLPRIPALKELIILICPLTNPKKYLVGIDYSYPTIQEEQGAPTDKEIKEAFGSIEKKHPGWTAPVVKWGMAVFEKREYVA